MSKIPAATAKGIIVMEHPFGTRSRPPKCQSPDRWALAREIPQPTPPPRPAVEKNASWSRDHRQDAGVIGCAKSVSISRPRARPAHEVIAFDSFLSPEPQDIGVENVEHKELSSRRISSPCIPATEKTRNIIDAAAWPG